MNKNNIFFQHGDRVLIINDNIFNTTLVKRKSIDLIVTSPPYNVDINYNSHNDKISYEQYIKFSKKWMSRCYSWLKDDGKFCLNIPLDKNKGGQQSVGADLTKIATEDVGFKYYTTIVWNEGNISRRTAWGSWKSASAPYVISPVELIVVFYKKNWEKTSGTQESDIEKGEYLEWINGFWTFNGEKKKKIGHPAPFPVMLPQRCMKLFSFKGDTVLDLFLGSGTTLVASYQNDRNGIGIEVDPYYCQIALNRLKKETDIDSGIVKKFDMPLDRKTRLKKYFITQSDLILQHFKDYPAELMTYNDIREWIKDEVTKGSFEPIKAPEKIMRSLVKNKQIRRLQSGQFVYR
ncbi:MAG: site-specific DNA-methyltransferase [Methanoregula sp.]|nr:site-specific DNA-methyltransferase [Methanoregula sp.]